MGDEGKMTKTICIIPARKGSKRLPGKNCGFLNGKILVDYTIDVALDCEFIDQIIFVSNDEKLLLHVGIKYESVDIILEPLTIAQDDSQAYEVVIHVIERLGQQFNAPNIIYLQPTSPLRNVQDLWETYHIFNFYNDPVTSVVYDEKWKYKLNGAIYYTQYSKVIEHKSLWKQANHLYVMPKERSINIDTQEDWDEAERILKNEIT